MMTRLVITPRPTRRATYDLIFDTLFAAYDSCTRSSWQLKNYPLTAASGEPISRSLGLAASGLISYGLERAHFAR